MVFELQARWRLYLFNLVHTTRHATRTRCSLRETPLSANVICYILCRTPLAELESTLDASDSHRTTLAGSRHIDPSRIGPELAGKGSACRRASHLEVGTRYRQERPKRSLYTSVPCSAAALSSPAFSSAALPAPSPPLSLADARRSGCSVAWLPGVARGWRAPTISREACDHSRKLPSARGSLAHLCVMKALFNTPCECGWSLFRVAHESPPASRPRPGNVDSHPRGWHRVSHTAHHDFHSFSPDFDRGVATRGGGAPRPHEQSAKSVLEPCCV